MVRLLLPLRREDHTLVRWSRFIDTDVEPASIAWPAVVARSALEDPEVSDLAPPTGELDPDTASVLREVISDSALVALRWRGYADAETQGPTIDVYGDEYASSALTRTELRVDERVPEYAWDRSASLAWDPACIRTPSSSRAIGSGFDTCTRTRGSTRSPFAEIPTCSRRVRATDCRSVNARGPVSRCAAQDRASSGWWGVRISPPGP